MLKHLLAFSVSVFLALAVFYGVEGLSSSFNSCVDNESAGERQQTTEENKSGIRAIAGVVGIRARCTGGFINSHNGGITALATLIVAAFTATLWLATSGMLRAAGEQGAAMESSAREAAKSAAAMVSVADSMKANVKALAESLEVNKQISIIQKSSVETQFKIFEMQLRAYVSVIIGTGIYQDRANTLRFQGGASLINSGATPAHKVIHKTRAGILPIPLPSPREFELILPQEAIGEDMLPPHSAPFTVSYVVPNFYDDTAVDDIKRGKDYGLYVWGTVTYEDAFAKPHETRFCHLLTWLPDGRIWGYYIAGRNTMT
jgi:hypothetical protein